MFEVKGKGWEVDRGFGELIGKELTRKEAEELVKKTPPIPLAEADAKAEQVFKDKLTKVTKAYPDMDTKRQEIVAAMLYQGADVTQWKNSNAAIKKAVKSQDDTDWLAAQSHLLNSLWATEQTPARALRVVHSLHPDTDINVLATLLEGFKTKRKGGVK